MKNIHTLQTDKTSRLLFNSSYESFCFQKEENGMFINDGKVSNASFWTIEKAQSNGFKPHHIYITSDEEIKEGDWFYNPSFNEIGINYNPDGCKKIILTTDQDLIKDGVQAIDDEFLEWFVKNPSCKSVEVIPSEFLADKVIYEINIPQEEPKEETTLEKAAQKHLNEKYQKGSYLGNLFIAGAKWQAKRMYSEEDLRRAYTVGKHGGVNQTYYDFDEWFEQFKKK